MPVRFRSLKFFPQFFLLLLVVILVTILAAPAPQTAVAQSSAKYIVLFIGDGMGPEHVKAGRLYDKGTSGPLYFEGFPNKTLVYHNNVRHCTTDSAASATAMATGIKVEQGVLSKQYDENGVDQDLQTILEYYRDAVPARRTGIVTTSYATDATPAAFGAHVFSRSDYADIFDELLFTTTPNVLFGAKGAGSKGIDVAAARDSNDSPYKNRVAEDKNGMLGLSGPYAAGFFGDDNVMLPAGMSGRDESLPTLPEMTTKALDLLYAGNNNGFFLVVEHEGTDEWSHNHHEAGADEKVVLSVVELDDAVQTAENWLNDRGLMNQALILVTADHETGALSTSAQPNQQPGDLPIMNWNSSAFNNAEGSEQAPHTQEPVQLFANGVGADQVSNGVPLQNSDIYRILRPEQLSFTAAAPIINDLYSCIWSAPDDVAERNGNVLHNDEDLGLGYHINSGGGKVRQIVGLRFRQVDIPPGATINSAQIEFVAAQPGSGQAQLTISGQDNGTAAKFKTGSGTADVSSRSKTSATAEWTISSAVNPGETLLSPNIAAIVQEIVDRSDWNRLNDLAFFIESTGTNQGYRQVDGFQQSGSTAVNLWSAARLHVTFGDWHGSIAINLDVSEFQADETPFPFESAALGNFTLKAPSDPQKVFSGLSPGTYDIRQDLPWPWSVDIVCTSDRGTPIPIDGAVWGATITLAQGENAACTFYNLRFTPPLGRPGAGALYLSPTSAGSVGGISFEKGDLLYYDGSEWRRYDRFDDVNGISRVSGGAFLTFSVAKNLGVGQDPDEEVQPQDVVEWIPLYPSGFFEGYFDGSKKALHTAGEIIDALHVLENGDLLVSTAGDFSVAGNLNGEAADILRFKQTQCCAQTIGYWTLFLDASDISGLSGENVTALWLDESSGDVYLGLADSFNVGGVAGTADDVLKLTNNAGSYSASLAWVGADNAYSGGIGALEWGMDEPPTTSMWRTWPTHAALDGRQP